MEVIVAIIVLVIVIVTLGVIDRAHARWAWRWAREETIAEWKRMGRPLPPGFE